MLARSARNGGTSHTRGGGFTLIEAAIATALVGLGIAALMVSLAAGSRSNDAGRELTQATYLTQEIHEWMMTLAFRDPQNPTNPVGPDVGDAVPDDVDDLKGAHFGPPRDGAGLPIAELPDWSQDVAMTWKAGTDLNGQDQPDGSTDYVRVNATVKHNGRTVLTTGWLVSRRTTE